MSGTLSIGTSSSTARYDRGTILFHWGTAALVLCLALTGELLNTFSHPVHHAFAIAHMTCGVVLSVVMLARIAWRLLAGRHLPVKQSRSLHQLAFAVAMGLYALIITEATLGFLWRWGHGRAMAFFAFSIPSPLAVFPKNTTSALGSAHWWLALVIIAVVLGHVAAAVWHLRRRDGVFSRML
ncbi:cytochrome b/b6 domain-containing protein [Acetobacter farinalis]|uniref:Cytochrome b/b6 domain-containing protein n=1 Tax=Acetobacter farinalis TaxID=1260984 RepID=A0ABT3Q7B2_9PROT|nr:cytochrome b/b6 domain-containing protein [Acetobacter farinalis]MCX2561171.1 cytochrome b/b6 domain-containing protein [Acetobacter farinalis]